MHKFENSLEVGYQSSGKKSSQEVLNQRRTRITINVSGNDWVRCRGAVPGGQKCG
jgi:tRNA threonylcarbamoyladenosine modification (KEOPS) complex  Pcc1 subunit